MTGPGQSPGFLAVVLEDKVMPYKERIVPDNLLLRCLGPRTRSLNL